MHEFAAQTGRVPARAVVLVVLGVVVTLAAAIGLTVRPRLERWLRSTVITTLERRLDSDVELRSISVRPGLVTRISGGPLTIRHRSRQDVAPLISLDHFETTMTWRQLLRRPRRVDTVTLTGLAIAIPPSRDDGTPRFPRREDTDHAPGEPAAARPPAEGDRRSSRGTDGDGGPPEVIIGRITAVEATLVVLPREKRKLPRRFVMHRVSVRDITTDRPMAFEAVLENPQPQGRIDTVGTFGPWNVESPARTPLQADYRFVDADLSTIRGIGGILQSEGRYSGVLERIEATGTTTMPAFDLKVGGRPLPLSTRFTVVVDGTNGNTYIQPADALLGARTPIRVTGGIVKAEDRRGRTVDLALGITAGRLEEVLALVTDGPPAMRGQIGVDAALLIPPGPVPVLDRLKLEGRFSLSDTAFTSRALQAKLDELSRRAQGRPDDPDVAHVVSAFSGRFRMAEGVIRFPSLTFDVDGARVELAGHYVVRGQALHFDGRVRLEAGVSRMVTGKKRWLLRPFDGLFRRQGATEFPIHIRGSVKDPQFGVDVKETLKRALIPGR